VRGQLRCANSNAPCLPAPLLVKWKLYITLICRQIMCESVTFLCWTAVQWSNQPLRLKNWTARSCFSASARVLNVPRFFRLPVFASTLREYRRYLPDFSFLIMNSISMQRQSSLAGSAVWFAKLLVREHRAVFSFVHTPGGKPRHCGAGIIARFHFSVSLSTERIDPRNQQAERLLASL